MIQSPQLPTKVGISGTIKDRRGNESHFTIIDEVKERQTTDQTKFITLQKVRFDKDGREELRLAYYRFNNGKWVFGRDATFTPVEDLKEIIRKAKEKNWF